MTENTEKAFKKYRSLLTKNKLKEGETYDCNFQMRNYLEVCNIDKIKPVLFVSSYETSPLLVLECYEKEEFKTTIDLADPSFTLDKYDSMCIIDKADDELKSSIIYDVKEVKDIIKKIKLKKEESSAKCRGDEKTD